MKRALFFLFFFTTSLFAAEKIVIIGAGPAGLTSAIYAAQAKLNPIVALGYECEGLSTVFHIENYPGFPEGINGEELTDRMKLQAEKFGTRFKSGFIVHVDLSNRPFALTFDNGEVLYTESLIIALGTSKRRLGLAAEEQLEARGIGESASCEAPLYENKEVVVIGGADAACEEALTLAEYAAKVTLIYRSNKLTAAPYLIEKIQNHPKIQVVLNSVVEEILDISQNKVTAVLVRNTKSGNKNEISCEGLFVSIGREPNTSLFKGQLEISPSGHLVVEPHKSQTSVKGVFAAGDIADPNYKKAITAAGSGCMAAIDAIRFLSEP